MIDEKLLLEEIEKSMMDNPHTDGKIAMNHTTEHQHFIAMVNRQPKVGDWIPCDKCNLPDKEVLCCDKYGEQMIGWVCEDETSDTGFSADSDECHMHNCVAWMPLPEAYIY